MYKQFYAGMDFSTLPIVVMLFFLWAFGMVLFRVMQKRAQPELERASRLPLESDSPLLHSQPHRQP